MTGRRIILALLSAPMLGCSSIAGAAPEFAPKPRQGYEGFVAINPPRTEVPVGALWIDGYGPTGGGASSDNLEIVRSLNALTIDKNLQLSLSAGLLDLIGIDPKLRDHYVAKFTDLSIICVKDISKLSGPKGEPRIVQALKAGSVTISSDSAFGLNGQTIGFQKRNGEASATVDRSRTYAIEARDMFVAIRVATPELVTSEERELRLSRDLRTAQIDDYLLVISRDKCQSAVSPCRPAIGIAKQNSYGMGALAPSVGIGFGFSAKLPLPVPIADGHGGLFDTLLIRWIAACSELKGSACRGQPRLFARYEGTRLVDSKSTSAKDW